MCKEKWGRTQRWCEERERRRGINIVVEVDKGFKTMNG